MENNKSNLILGMVMLADEDSYDLNKFIADFKAHYDLEMGEPEGDNASAIVTIDGETIAIAPIPMPIPSDDIEGTARYAYNWQTALEDLKDHKSHLLVTVFSSKSSPIQRFSIFTRVICSLLRTTNSLGVYKGSQSLLIPKEDYLNESQFLDHDMLPLNLWIYFGLRGSDKGKSGYTYGLNLFDKTEMEIINSSKGYEEIRDFLFNMALYILEYDVTFKDGETCGLTEAEKIKITYSKGAMLEGETFKLAY